MQGPIERRAPKRIWKLAPPRPGAAAPLDPGWGRLRPQTPEKLRGGSVGRKGRGPLPGMQREQGVLLQGLRMARPWKPAWFEFKESVNCSKEPLRSLAPYGKKEIDLQVDISKYESIRRSFPFVSTVASERTMLI